MKHLIIGIITIFIFSRTYAETNATTPASRTKESSESESFFSNVKPFLGLNTGYTTRESSLYSEGVPANIKLIGSYFFPSQEHLVDLGLGFSNQQFTNRSAIQSYKSGGLFEAAYRYQWENKMQAGLVVDDFFNQGKNYGANQADVQFGGLQVVKEFSLQNSNLARFGVKALTELNPDTRHYANMLLLDLQIGLGGEKSESLVQEFQPQPPPAPQRVAAPTTPVVMEPKVAEPRPLAQEPSAKKSKEVEKLKNAIATFDSAKYLINSSDKRYLQNLSQTLKNNKNLYSKIVIHGYADASGTSELNRKLSRQRAQAVADYLEKNAKFAKNQIEIVAEGAPVNTNTVKPEDRKVEIELQGVKNDEQLQNILSKIK